MYIPDCVGILINRTLASRVEEDGADNRVECGANLTSLTGNQIASVGTTNPLCFSFLFGRLYLLHGRLYLSKNFGRGLNSPKSYFPRYYSANKEENRRIENLSIPNCRRDDFLWSYFILILIIR